MKKTLEPSRQKFVLHWGEMGARWGINRTVAQIHALLFLSPVPLHAEEIAETLDIARSNVSNSLRELQNWGIVKVTHVMGDRRDHFESLKDVPEMFRVILHERKRREMDPTIHLLKDCQAAAAAEKHPEPYVTERLDELLKFFEMMSGWYDQLNRLPTGAMIKFVKMGDRAFKVMGG